jgi:tetratricopeptide (TPR) repeat protein
MSSELPMLKPRDPLNDQNRLREIRGALALSDPKRAVMLACRALDDGLNEPLLFYLRAKARLRQNRPDEAARDLIQAAARASDDVRLRFACGAELIALQQFADAIPVLEEAIRLDPTHAPGHFSLGWALEVMGDSVRALDSFEKVLTLDPRHAAALARLACIALHMGDMSLARDYAERSLAIDANEYEALCATVKIALAANDFDRAEQFLQRLLQLKTLAPDDHATVMGMVGDLRHAQMRFADAFRAYGAANSEKRNYFAPRFERPAGQRFGDYVHWLAAQFESGARAV